jgi:transglutaminase-like putative cysteine protease
VALTRDSRGRHLSGRYAEIRPAAAAAVAGVAIAATGAWSSLIGSPPSLFAPIAAVAALLAAGWLSRWAAAAALVAWIPGAVLLAGVPVRALAPGVWPALIGHVVAGVAQLSAPAGRPAGGTWSVAAAALGSGILWVAGSGLATSSSLETPRRIAAFGLLAAPWIAAVGLSRGDHAGWQGAVVLLAGLLWFSVPRLGVALGVGAALLSVALAQAVGPRTPWIDVGQLTTSDPSFNTLLTAPTYGPLTGRRTGVPMLEIDAARPALWRMQTLDYVDASGWSVSPTDLPKLPQPAAQQEEVTVRVLGLRNDLVVAPGRIERVEAGGKVTPTGGEAWRVATGLATGDTYAVRADYVRATADQLARDRAAIGPRARAYTRFGLPAGRLARVWAVGRLVVGLFGLDPRGLAQSMPDPRVVALARRLSAGARTEWEVVSRVERFLLDPRRFRYTTRVPKPGPQPLADFLLRSRAGYCQQFAGAAALLLRLDGVPARVVAGFATGVRTGPERYTVRDLDAHDWIEVYFPGYGWVPFNPTPSADLAAIASGLDPLRSPTRGAGHQGVLPVVALLAGLAALALTGIVLGRRRSRPTPDRLQRLLERLARRTGARLEPSSTLSELGAALARLGPRTAELVAETERNRFAAGAAAPAARPRLRLARALVSDVGPVRALLLCAPALRRLTTSTGLPPTAQGALGQALTSPGIAEKPSNDRRQRAPGE